MVAQTDPAAADTLHDSDHQHCTRARRATLCNAGDLLTHMFGEECDMAVPTLKRTYVQRSVGSKAAEDDAFDDILNVKMTVGSDGDEPQSQDFCVEKCRWVNVPWSVRMGIISHHQQLDDHSQELQGLKADFKRMEMCLQKEKEKGSAQLDWIRQGVCDVAECVNARRSQRKPFVQAVVASVAARRFGAPKLHTPTSAMGMNRVAVKPLDDENHGDYSTPNANRRPGDSDSTDSSDSFHRVRLQAVSKTTNQIEENLRGLQGEMRSLKGDVSGLQKCVKSAEMKITEVWERMNRDLGDKSLRDFLWQGMRNMLPKWFHWMGVVQESSAEAVTGLFRDVVHLSKGCHEFRQDCRTLTRRVSDLEKKMVSQEHSAQDVESLSNRLRTLEDEFAFLGPESEMKSTFDSGCASSQNLPIPHELKSMTENDPGSFGPGGMDSRERDSPRAHNAAVAMQFSPRFAAPRSRRLFQRFHPERLPTPATPDCGSLGAWSNQLSLTGRGSRLETQRWSTVEEETAQPPPTSDTDANSHLDTKQPRDELHQESTCNSDEVHGTTLPEMTTVTTAVHGCEEMGEPVAVGTNVVLQSTSQSPIDQMRKESHEMHKKRPKRQKLKDAETRISAQTTAKVTEILRKEWETTVAVAEERLRKEVVSVCEDAMKMLTKSKDEVEAIRLNVHSELADREQWISKTCSELRSAADTSTKQVKSLLTVVFPRALEEVGKTKDMGLSEARWFALHARVNDIENEIGKLAAKETKLIEEWPRSSAARGKAQKRPNSALPHSLSFTPESCQFPNIFRPRGSVPTNGVTHADRPIPAHDCPVDDGLQSPTSITARESSLFRESNSHVSIQTERLKRLTEPRVPHTNTKARPCVAP